MRCPNCGASMNNGHCSYCSDTPKKKVVVSNSSVNTNTKKKSLGFPIIIIVFIAICICNNIDLIGSNKNVTDTKSRIIKVDSIDKKYDINRDFLLYIEDSFSASKGLIVTGRIESGKIKVGDRVRLIGLDHNEKKVKIRKIELYKKEVKKAEAGDSVSLLLDIDNPSDIELGMVLTSDKSLKCISSYDAVVYFYTSDEGGMSSDISDNYKTKFSFNNNYVTGTLKFDNKNKVVPYDVTKASPGDDNVFINIKLDKCYPISVDYDFSIVDDEKVIARGFVTKINK